MTYFGGSTFSFMWNCTALDAMRQMQTLGLEVFDIIMVPGHLWHDELGPGQRVALAETLRAEGLRIDSLNLPALDQNLASCIPEARAYAVELYRRAMRLSADLGGQAIVAVPGRVSSLFPPPTSSSEDWLQQSLFELLREADALDQRIYIEVHPQTPVPTVDKIERLLARLEHARLQVAYDVSNAEFMGEDQADALRRLAPRLGQVHLSDGTRTAWRHDAVGCGSVDFSAIAEVLREIDFRGVQVLEIISAHPLRDIASSMALLKNVTQT